MPDHEFEQLYEVATNLWFGQKEMSFENRIFYIKFVVMLHCYDYLNLYIFSLTSSIVNIIISFFFFYLFSDKSNTNYVVW